MTASTRVTKAQLLDERSALLDQLSGVTNKHLLAAFFGFLLGSVLF